MKNFLFRFFSVVYIPFFTIIEFIGYIGWIKVAETLLNPWGDDDEDFQINYLIDRNFQVEKNIWWRHNNNKDLRNVIEKFGDDDVGVVVVVEICICLGLLLLFEK